MKILIISQRYWPENFRITDIAEELAQRKHNVTVFTGLPNYPEGYVWKEYSRGRKRNQIHNGVKIVRTFEIGRRKNLLFRFLNYYSFPLFSNKALKSLENDYDVVLVNELSPIMCCLPGIKYAKKHCKNIIMYEMDLWPESLLAGGVSKKSLIYKHYKKVSSNIYSSFDKILVSTKEHIDYIKSLPNCSNLNIECLPQYGEDQFLKKPKFSHGPRINLMFAGNIGKAQSVITILKAANILKNDPMFHFTIVGNGSEFDNCLMFKNDNDLKNVDFLGKKKISDMVELYNRADVMIVSLENKSYANYTIPGKIQGYCASSKPVVGAASGATQKLIRENDIGFCVDAEDFVSFANSIKLITFKDMERWSINSNKIYEKKYRKSIFVDNLEKNLLMLKK